MPWRTSHEAQVVSKKLCDVSMGCSHPIPLCGEGWEFLSRNHLIPSQIAQAGGAHFCGLRERSEQLRMKDSTVEPEFGDSRQSCEV